MADQKNNDLGVPDMSTRILEDSSFDGSESNPIGSTGVVKVERAECENLGTSTCNVEQGMRNSSEPIAMESTCVVKVEGAECENLGNSTCTVEQGMRNSSGPISMESTCAVKVERAECKNLGTSTCTVEQGMRNSSEPIAMESTCAGKVERAECENLWISGCTIEEEMENISLVGGYESSVIIGENGGKGEIMSQEDVSESSDSERASPCSQTSSSTSCGGSTSDSSSDDDDNEDSKEEGQQEKREGQTEDIEVEVEEGEIRDSDGQNLVSETSANDDDDDDDVEVVSRSGINDDDVDYEDEDDANNNAMGGPIRSKNELENLPPVPRVDVTLEPYHQMLPVGVVMSILGAQVIVEGVEKHEPLNEGSILWVTESQTPLGLVDEIFGPVKNPYYVVRYNSEHEVPRGIHGGASISFVPEFADHVLNNKDLYRKGYDASGLNDEEMSDEVEFSDDEKEAEYKRVRDMKKRGINYQNRGKRKNNRKKVLPKKGPLPTYPAAPAAPSLDHGNFSPLSGIGQGVFGATTIVPPFPSTSAGPNLGSSGVWTSGISLLRPQSALLPNGLLPNGLPPNGISWFPGNTQNHYQLPVTGIPFQQQLNPSLGSLPTTIWPGVQPNMFAQPMYAQGLVGQSQMTFGMSSQIAQIQPTICSGEQGFLSNELQSETNRNSHSNTISDNRQAPQQFHTGASARRGRKTFHQRGTKVWRPAK